MAGFSCRKARGRIESAKRGMVLSFPTLLLTEACSLVTLSLLCLMLARAETSLGSLRLMGLGNLAMAAAMPLFLLRGGEWHLLGVMLGNGASFLGWGLHVTAIRRFAGHAGSILIGPIALVVWCLLCLWPPFMGSLAARTHGAGALSGAMTAMMAWDLCRSWTGPRPLRPLILLVCGAQSLALA